MSDAASGIQSSYLKLIQNQIDRMSNAYRRGSQGQYGFDEWFRDWSEAAADAVGTVWGPVKEILDTEKRVSMEAEPKQKGVWKIVRYSTREDTVLTTEPFQCEDENGNPLPPIPFKAEADADRRHLVISIDDVKEAPEKKTYTGAIIEDSAGKKTTLPVSLRIRKK